jgi:hypothetical protein
MAMESEARLDDLLEGVDVVLEIAREEFADLLVETVHVGDQREQAEEEHESYADADHCGCFLFAAPETDVEAGRGFAPLDSRGRLSLRGLVLSIRPSGRWSFARNCFSRLAIRPLSHS